MTFTEFLTNPYNLITIIIGLVSTIVLMIISSKNHTKSYQLRAYIPTVWTSLGIFFTFFAIWRGLPAIKGIEENKILETLIDKVIPAFSTSIIGIAGAVITSLINRIILADNERKINNRFDRLNGFGGIDSDSPELLLFKIVSAINGKENSIKSTLEANQSSTGRKSDELYSKIDQILQQLNGDTKSSIDEQTKKIQSGFGIVNERIESTDKSLNTALEIQKEDFLKVIKEIKDAFDLAMKNHNTTLSGKMDEQRKMLQEEVGKIKKDNDLMITSFVNSVKNDFVTVVKENIVKESEARTEQLKAFINGENEKMTSFIEKQEGLYQEIKKGLEDAVSDIRKLFEEDVQKSVEKFAQDQHELSTMTIAEWNKNLTEKSNEYLKSFEDSIGKLPEAMSKKLDELHEKENGLIESTIKENQGNIGTLLEENKAAIKTIADGIREDYEKIKAELKESQERWKEQATQIEKDNLDKIKAINEDTEGKVQAINQAISTFGERLQNSFDDVKGEVKEAIDNNKTSLEELLSANKLSIKTVSDEIKKDNDNIVTELTSAQKRWKDAAIEMEREHFGEIKKINQDAAYEMQSIQTKITKIESALHTSLDAIMEKVTKSIEHFEEKQKEIKSFVLENNKGLQTDLTKQIHDAFQINELSKESSKLATAINDTINSLNTQTNNILGNLSKINDSLNASSEKYNNTVVNSNELITYITSTLNLFKSHITDMSVLCSEMSTLHSEVETFQKALDELEKSIKQVQDLNKEVERKVKQDKH